MRFFKTFVFVSSVVLLAGQSACGRSTEAVEDGLSPDQLQRKWKAEQQGQTVGHTASFDVSGSPLVLTASGTTHLTVPTTLVVGALFPKNKPYVFFVDAVVGAQTGLLVLEGERLSLTAGTLGQVELEEVLARTHLADGRAAPAVVLTARKEFGVTDPTVTFPEDWSEADSALFFADPVALRPNGMTLTGFTRGVLVTASGATALSGSVTVTSATRMYWDAASRFESQTSLVDAPRFALGGALTGGSLESTGPSASPPPGGLMGEGARVLLEPGRARSEGAFQLTQAMADAGPLVPAEVQVAFDPKPLTVKPSGRGLVTVVYREKTMRGDAVLADIQVTGSGRDAVRIALDQPESIVRELWDAVLETGYVSPIFAAPVLVASPFIALGESLSCLFSTCPEAYSAWMRAGTVARFHIIVQGSLPPGPYSVDVTLTGRNHPAVTIPVQFTIPG
ncbi:MAG: hypothetical protein ABW123_25245 [Cystobacter sp.]